MSFDPADNDLIEQYILGKLSGAEVRKFESRLDDDREFARKYRLISTFPEMMSELGRQEYAQKLVKDTAPADRPEKKIFPERRVLYIAAFLTLVTAGIILFIIFRGTNKEETIGNQDLPVKKDTSVKNPAKKAIPALKDTLKTTATAALNENGGAIKPGGQKPLELLNPASGIAFTRKEIIWFNWQQKADTFTRFYIVSELHDQVVYWRGIRPGVREQKVPGSYLFPGKYYWYVGKKDEKHTFTITE